MRKLISRLWRDDFAYFVAIMLCASLALAGIRNRHIHQFPPPAFVQEVDVRTFESVTSTKDPGWFLWLKRDVVFQGMQVVVRAMSGTITQATLMLYANGVPQLKTALDLYSTGLASAGTVLYVNPDQLKAWSPAPGYWPGESGGAAGYTIVGSIFLAGTNTPTLTDVTVEMLYRPTVGGE